MKIIRFARSHPRGTIFFLFLLALILRLGWLGFFEGRFTAADTDDYTDIAVNILQGKGYGYEGGPTAFVVPLYPFFLTGIFGLFGENLLAVQLVQMLLSALTVVLVYLIARRLFDPSAGVIAALIAAVHPWLIFWSGYVLTETLFVFLLTAAILAYVYLVKKPSLWKALGSGILLGLSALCRPVGLQVALALIFVWLLLAPKSSRRWPVLGILLVSMSLILSPWIIRNYLVFHKFVPVSSASGAVLYLGNNPKATILANDMPDPLFPPGMDEIESSYYLQKLALKYIIENPGRFFVLALKRLYYYWSPEFPTYSIKHKVFNCLLYLPLYLAALWGLFSLRQWRQVLLFLAIFGVFTLVHMITIVDWDQRYRLPLQPFLAVLAGAGVAQVIRRLQARSDLPESERTR